MSAYVTGLGACLPNAPVYNDQIETVFRSVIESTAVERPFGRRLRRLKDMILKRNGIASRHYVIDPATGRQTHTNAQMTAEAVQTLAKTSGFDLRDMEVLACGTSSPDQLIPSHAAMVQGLIGGRPCELASMSGVCCSGMAAAKYGYMCVLTGANNAVVTGSDLASVGGLIRNEYLRNSSAQDNDDEPFDSAFLRWMLSDGAGAMLIEPKPRAGAMSLRIDWMDVFSLANELETCMYWGAVKNKDGTLRTWRELANFEDVCKDGYFNYSQDVQLLNDKILNVGMRRTFAAVRDKRGLRSENIDWLLPHISSYFFQQNIYDILKDMGVEIPYEKWFLNLESKGNTGAASIYIMLEELYRSGRLRSGHRLFLAVPESARFTFSYMHLTVV